MFLKGRTNALVFPSLLLITLISWGNSAAIYLKAQLAQVLIESAWQKTLDGGRPSKPWSWADTWPVARIRSQKPGSDLFVLAGANGGSLAFGPGHVQGTALPGAKGTSVIAGHRDTHYKFLQHLRLHDHLQLQDTSGVWHHYAVTAIQIVDTDQSESWQLDLARDELHLITCYPFDAITPNGPLRYIVTLRNLGSE